MNDLFDEERAAIMEFDGKMRREDAEKLSQVVGKKLRPYQESGIEELRTKLRAGKKRVIFYLPTGGGKCLGNDTPVLMYDGTVKRVQDVRRGDLLIGPDSKPRTVLATTEGFDNLYRVVPVKGDPYIVNEPHLLSLKMTGGSIRSCGIADGTVLNMTVRDYLKQTKTFRHCAKGWRAPANFRPGNELLIDPYFLGAWLGDGHSSGPTITSGDHEIVSAAYEIAASFGLTVKVDPNSTNSKTYRLTNSSRTGNRLHQVMLAYGLIGAKHIPHDYKRASRSDRLALLAGVLDTDGYYDGKAFYLTLKSERLFDDCVFLARSLGFAIYKREVIKTCANNGKRGKYFSGTITGDTDEIPVRLSRRKANPRQQKKNHLVTGICIEPVGWGAFYGFSLDGDGLFLLGDFTVTHNTEVAAAITRSATDKGKRAAFVCNRIELVRQASARFNADALYHGVLQGSNSYGEWNSLMICSIQTIARRSVEDFDLIIVDEAHACAGTKAYHDLFKKFSDVPIIGLTATPFSKGLAKHHDDLGGPLFEDIVIAATIPDLIRDGFLVDIDIYGPSEPDLSGVKVVAGDYHQGQLDTAVDKPELIGDIVTHWKKLGGGMPTICFATNIAHSKHIQEQFLAAGVGCEHIDCYTEEFDRKKIDGFKAGEFHVLTNVSVLAEGFDAPKASVMILARPTKSLVRYIQMAGRVLRPAEGKTRALMLDHSGTAKRLGFPTDELPLELDDGKPNETGQRAEKEKPLPKPCPSCHFLKPPKVHQCPACGFKPERQSEVEVEEGDLEMMRRPKLNRDDKAVLFGELKHIAQSRGYRDGWASHKFREMTGVWPNAYKSAAPRQPSAATLNWLKSRQIAWAKARG